MVSVIVLSSHGHAKSNDNVVLEAVEFKSEVAYRTRVSGIEEQMRDDMDSTPMLTV